MAASHIRRARKLPKVALLIETSLGSGRDILKGIARYLGERGPWSIYHEPRSLGGAIPDWLRRWRGDGVIARVEGERTLREVKRPGRPVVDVLGEAAAARIPLVHVDDVAIAELAAEHLLSLGLRQFAYCGIAHSTWSARRRSGYETYIRAKGYSCATFEWPAASRMEEGWELAQDRLSAWLETLPKPVGIMVCSDQRGVAVLDACRRVGIAVPEQAAVIGVDNDDALCSVCDPPLTSVIPNHTEVGYRAAALLDRLMRGETWNGRADWVRPAGIATRRSTDTLAVEDDVVRKALHFIRNHACEGCSVDEVAHVAAVSRSVLQRRFRRALGHTVHDELVSCRIRRAMNLLSGGDISLAEVAEVAGFKHQEYMGVVFKTHTGRTPAAYRRATRREMA